MTYQAKLRELRGDLRQDEVAAKAGLSRATIVNAENEQERLRFSTVAQIVRALGHRDDSSAMRDIALLWLQSVSGIQFGVEEASDAIKHLLTREKFRNAELLDQLSNTIATHGLSPKQIALLTWAASRAPALELLEHARQLEAYSVKGDIRQFNVSEHPARIVTDQLLNERAGDERSASISDLTARASSRRKKRRE